MDLVILCRVAATARQQAPGVVGLEAKVSVVRRGVFRECRWLGRLNRLLIGLPACQTCFSLYAINGGRQRHTEAVAIGQCSWRSCIAWRVVFVRRTGGGRNRRMRKRQRLK